MQGVLDFDLSAKLGAVARLNAPVSVRRLLAALAVFGCRNPQRVAVGDGDEDSGEWLVDASKRELAIAVGLSRSAVKKWLRNCEETVFMAITKSTDQAHTYYVRWPSIFASSVESDPGHFDKVPRGTFKSDPGHSPKVTRVTSTPDIGKGGSPLKPTKRSYLSNTNTKPEQPKADFEVNTGQKSFGKTITAHDLRSPVAMLMLVEHAVGKGFVGQDDAQHVLAFLAWVARQPESGTGALLNKPAFVAKRLASRKRSEWGLRAERQDYQRAKEILAAATVAAN